LHDAFTPGGLKFALQRSDALMPAEGFAFDPLAIERAMQFRLQHDAARLAIRTAFAQSDARLWVDHRLGVGVDVSFIDVARVYNRLEFFLAAEQLAGGRQDDAIETLDAMLRVVDRLAGARHLASRLAAMQSRREALALLQAIAGGAATSRLQAERLRNMIAGELAAWPRERDAWIADRAEALHTYEMIRDGQLASLLTEEEMEKHNADGDALAAAAMRGIDDDEAFYLGSIRRLIDAADQPYYQRRETYEQLRQELKSLLPTPQYPLLADQMFLANIPDAQRLAAADRAWTEAWSVALCIALDESRAPPFDVNPLTGKPYRIAVEANAVVVAGIDPLDPHAMVRVHRSAVVSVRTGARASR
ncbi:MAG: hypothetical protein KDA41_07250, partial [Planctomycetales bacterium]|nr:hypothetical protein [Planctomycetales bacterium]